MKKRYFRGMTCIGILVLIATIIVFALFLFFKSKGDKALYSYEENENAYYLIADEYIIRVYTDAWTDIEQLGYNNAYDFLLYCNQCIVYLVEKTNKVGWMDKIANISEDGKAIVTICTVNEINSQVRFSEGIVYLNKDNIELAVSDIEHELTHLIMGECNEGTLSEGFATYMEHVEFGANNYGIYGLSIDVVIQNLYFDPQYEVLTQEILESIGAAYDSSIKHQQYGEIFYVYAGSYINYLVNTYGIEAVVGIFDASGSDSAYQRYLGKDMLTVKADWMEYLKQYDGEMSVDEIIEFVSK